MMIILKLVFRIKFLDVGGVNMNVCVNVFFRLDRYFFFFVKVMLCIKDEFFIFNVDIGIRK